MSEKRAVINIADMSEEMQQEAVDCATQALEKYNIEKDIAAYIKKEGTNFNQTLHFLPKPRRMWNVTWKDYLNDFLYILRLQLCLHFSHLTHILQLIARLIVMIA